MSLAALCPRVCPDSYKFYGSTLEKHRQIGNAVPPPMGRALGLQSREVLASKALLKTGWRWIVNAIGDVMGALVKCPLTTVAECHATDVVKLLSSRIELEIFSLRGRCSTNELYRLKHVNSSV